MKIVVDVNRLIAALIKDNTTRNILFDSLFKFIAPDFILTEVRKYDEEIIKKANITKEQFEILLILIFENITIIPKKEYEYLINQLQNEITDQKDLPYMAVAFLTRADGIWSHDNGFLKQNKIKIFTNIDLLNISKKSKQN